MNTKIPSLKQSESSFTRYRNPLNEARLKSESNSFEAKVEDYQQQFAPTPIYSLLNNHRHDEFNSVASQFMQKLHTQQHNNSLASIITQELRTNQTIQGSKILCKVDCLLVNRYFNQKNWIFQDCNQRYKLEAGTNTNVEWLKRRIVHRYKTSLQDAFLELVSKIEEAGELQAEQPIRLNNVKAFQNLERQIVKSIKVDKSLECFIYDVQQCLADFIFTIFD